MLESTWKFSKRTVRSPQTPLESPLLCDSLSGICVDIEIGGSILNGYVELCSSSGDLDTAVQVVMDVLVAKIPLVQSSISAVLRGCVSNNDLRNLKRFLKAMRDSEMKEMQPDASCYTALITLLARAGRVDQMERAYEEMRLKELEPSNITFGAMLSCYVDFNNFPKSQEMWSELRRLQEEKGTRIPDHAWNSMLYAHVWQGDIDGAVQLFNEMKENLTLRPNTHSYTALLRLYAQNNDAHSALELFREMETNRVLPQLGTLNALIDCLTRAGNMEAAEEVYKHLETRQFVPSSDTYYLLIKGYCDQHDLDNAIRVYEACEKAEHVTPTQATLVVLLETLLKLDSGPARATQFLKETVRVYPRSAPGIYRAAISWYMAKGDDNKVAQYKADLQRVTGGSSMPAPTSKPSRAAPSIEEEGYSQQKHLKKTKVAPAKQEAHQEDEEVEPAAPAPVRNQPKQSKPAQVQRHAQVQRQRAPETAHVNEATSKKPAPGNSKPAPAPSAPVSSAQARKKVAKIVEQEQSQVEEEPAAPVAEKSKRRPPTPPNHQNQQKKAQGPAKNQE
jgi:pentatricopeptide repeat protein